MRRLMTTSWGLFALVTFTTLSLGVGCGGCGDESANNPIGDANPGKILANPTALVFPATNIGETSSATVTVLNTSASGTLRISSIRWVPEGASREILPDMTLWQPSGEIEPNGAPIELKLNWKPTDNVQDKGSIVIRSNDPAAEELIIPVSTPALAPKVIARSMISFPRVVAGRTEYQTAIIQNGGNAPLQLFDVLMARQNSDFAVSFPKEDDLENPESDSLTIPEGKNILEPNEELPIRVSFSPATSNPSTGELLIQSNAPEQIFTIALSGNSGGPCISLAGASLADNSLDGETHNMNFGESQIGVETTKTIQIENCSPSNPLTINGIQLSDDAGGVYNISALPGTVADGDPLTLEPLTTATFAVGFSPTDEVPKVGRILIQNSDPTSAELRVAVRGKGTNNVCPIAVAEGVVQGSGGNPAVQINTIPLKTIELSAGNSSDPNGQVASYQWRLVSKPIESTERFEPSSTQQNTRLFLDFAGTYEIELSVTDDQGLESCTPAKMIVVARPNEAISVSLAWSNAGNDVDLHYLRTQGRWNQSPGDIFWQNITSDWGQIGNPNDDPSLDIDDTDGYGPENINHDNPVPGAYSVGVHYFADNGLGATYATVRVYVEGTQKLEIREKFLEQSGIFWDVARIQWPSKDVIRVDRIYDGFP